MGHDSRAFVRISKLRLQIFIFPQKTKDKRHFCTKIKGQKLDFLKISGYKINLSQNLWVHLHPLHPYYRWPCIVESKIPSIRFSELQGIQSKCQMTNEMKIRSDISKQKVGYHFTKMRVLNLCIKCILRGSKTAGNQSLKSENVAQPLFPICLWLLFSFSFLDLKLRLLAVLYSL